jgi:hypothetical protein
MYSRKLEKYHPYTCRQLREWVVKHLPHDVNISNYTKKYKLSLKKNITEFNIVERGDEEFRKCFSLDNLHFVKVERSNDGKEQK